MSETKTTLVPFELVNPKAAIGKDYFCLVCKELFPTSQREGGSPVFHGWVLDSCPYCNSKDQARRRRMKPGTRYCDGQSIMDSERIKGG